MAEETTTILERLGGTLGVGPVIYQGGRDELNAKCRARDDEIDRLRIEITRLQSELNTALERVKVLEVSGERVRELLKRDGATQPFWTTTAGGGSKPFINIVCQDIEIMHALDDLLRAACRAVLQSEGK